MDPNLTLTLINSTATDSETRLELAQALAEWLKSGGFRPILGNFGKEPEIRYHAMQSLVETGHAKLAFALSLAVSFGDNAFLSV